MHKRVMALVLAAACLMLVLGCGDDGGTDVEITRPTVDQTSPQEGATGVSLIPLIYVWFSEEMDESSLGDIAVVGIATHHVDYDTLGNKATVYISEALDAETGYTVNVPATVTDDEGHTLGTAYTFGFTTGPSDCAHAADYLESNDTPLEASAIEFNKTYPVLSSCGAAERYDYYGFTVEEATKLTVRLRRVDGGPAVDWFANFSRHPYQIFNFGDYLRCTEDITEYFTFLPGTYNMKTGRYDEDGEIVFYSLTFETSAPCLDDDYEDNDFAFEGTPILPGHYEDLVSCYRDVDYYAIDLTVGQRLVVIADNVSGGSPDGGLYILDPGYNNVAQDVGTHNPLSTFWTATEEGTHRFVVAWPLAEVEYWMDVEVD